MKIIGLTGPTGSGKSTVSVLAEKLGFAVIDCDKVAKEVSNKSQVILKLTDAFGKSIIKDGSLDRKALAKIAFSSAQKTELLNSIMLPEISEEIEDMIATLSGEGKEYILLDAPTLYESGADKKCEAVIAVLANENYRKSRILSRDNLTLEQANDRLSASKEDNFYKEKTEHILYNNGGLEEFLISAEKLLKSFIG